MIRVMVDGLHRRDWGAWLAAAVGIAIELREVRGRDIEA
jgi:hypothetical protein